MEQQEKLSSLMRSVEAGRIVHALMFTGPEGTGKRTAAKWLTKALMCTGANKPCGVCPGCKQVEAGTHPDVHYVRPEKNLIRIDPIRDLVATVGMEPYSGKMHIAVIEGAERMNPNAQNALLKTLETPTGQVMFILLAQRTSGLLPTVVSRCQMLRFSPLSTVACQRILMEKGFAEDEARLYAGLAQGSVGRALALKEDKELTELRGTVLTALEALKNDASVALAAAPLAGDKALAEPVLDLMELWGRDLMALQNGAEPFEQTDIARLKKSKLDGKRMVECVMYARRQLQSNVSWTSVLETMFFKLI